MAYFFYQINIFSFCSKEKIQIHELLINEDKNNLWFFWT